MYSTSLGALGEAGKARNCLQNISFDATSYGQKKLPKLVPSRPPHSLVPVLPCHASQPLSPSERAHNPRSLVQYSVQVTLAPRQNGPHLAVCGIELKGGATNILARTRELATFPTPFSHFLYVS